MPFAPKNFRPPRIRTAAQRSRQKVYQSKEFRAVREKVLVRDSYTCQNCGRIVQGKEAHVDHIVPLELGGAPFDETNLRVLCARCNGKKAREMQNRT